jgi:hypothetical protein
VASLLVTTPPPVIVVPAAIYPMVCVPVVGIVIFTLLIVIVAAVLGVGAVILTVRTSVVELKVIVPTAVPVFVTDVHTESVASSFAIVFASDVDWPLYAFCLWFRNVGIAIAARMARIATTTSSSMRENPLSFSARRSRTADNKFTMRLSFFQ